MCVCVCVNVVSDVSGADEGEMNISDTIENQFTLPRLGRKCGAVRRHAKNAVKRKKTKIILIYTIIPFIKSYIIYYGIMSL